MFGRLFFFLVGVYGGVVANQRYRLPNAPTPGEAWDKFKARMEERRKDCPHFKRHRFEDRDENRQKFFEDPEVKEVIDRLKALEQQLRRKPSEEQ